MRDISRVISRLHQFIRFCSKRVRQTYAWDGTTTRTGNAGRQAGTQARSAPPTKNMAMKTIRLPSRPAIVSS